MKIKKAIELAVQIKRELSPYCERIEIAGSVRRQKPEVKDLELVAIPKPRYTTDLFGTRVQDGWEIDYPLNQMRMNGWRFLKGGAKYKQLHSEQHHINLDLFLVIPPAEWGVIYTIRTGSADFSHWLVTHRKYGGALPSDCKVRDGAVWRGDGKILMPEETDFLALCGLPYIEPEQRTDRRYAASLETIPEPLREYAPALDAAIVWSV